MKTRAMSRYGTRILLGVLLVALTIIASALFVFGAPETAHAQSYAHADIYNVKDCEKTKDTAQSIYTGYCFTQNGAYTRITGDCVIDASGHDTIYFKSTVSGELGLLYHVTYHSGNVNSSYYPFAYLQSRNDGRNHVIGGNTSSETIQQIALTYVDATFTLSEYTRGYSYNSSAQSIELIDRIAHSYTVRIVRDSDLSFGGSAASSTSIAATFSAGDTTYKLNGIDMGTYSSGGVLSVEGRYEITNTLVTGRKKSIVGYVDSVPPELKVSSEAAKSSNRATWSVGSNESPVTCTYTLTNSDGTSGVSAYTSGSALTAEGKYTLTATDLAGNSSSVTLYVDRTSPVLSRSFEYGKTDGAVTFANNDWESPLSATYSYTGVNGSVKDVAYKSGERLTNDGEYTVTVTDKAGNSADIKLVIDRKAPTLMFGDGTTGASQLTRSSSSVSWSAEKYEAPITTTYSFVSADENIAPSVSNAPYASGGVITAEGTYSFTATDRAGNTAVANVVIDKTPPTLKFVSNGATFEKYINTAFTASGDDGLSGIASVELYENGKYINYDYVPRGTNGEYLFRITDKAGNITSASAVVYGTDTFGNVAAIRDGYKVNAWYTVTLPARIFTTSSGDVAGRYSFESYEKALEFAMSKEREYRVTSVQGGYMYVSASNESIAQKYDSEASVSVVVEKYAKSYVSARRTLSSSGNDNYYIEPESLTRNDPVLPDHLLDLKGLPRYFASPTVRWSLPELTYLNGMDYTVTAEYLGDFVADRGGVVAVPRGSTLLSAFGSSYKQGWYLITETDEAGNKEMYLIYSDAELPTVRVKATFGDGDKDFVLDYDYTKNETLYFISLGLSALLDNIDDYVTLKLEKGMNVWYFTQADTLPTLGSGEYTSGKYTITVYDRSMNVLAFDAYIAGAAPTMTHGSLAADKTECKINFVASDRYNVITGITLYKIEYDGTKTALDIDGTGTPISAATLGYTLTVGGKYGATLTDNYRRTVELDPIFFLKGLPNGRLAGVADGGRTNNNVSFTFDSGDVCELYILLPNGERQAFADYTIQTGAAQTVYNITACETTSHEFLVFLHNAQDLSLFVEYTFEIDTILPTFEITDSDGNSIQPDGATNRSFSIRWSETGVTLRYYTAKGGALSATQYKMSTVLSQGTLYYFTLKDDVGNTLDFTVLLDNVVDYKIDGEYTQVDGVLYSKGQLTFTVNEPTQVFDVANTDGYGINNGGTLTQAGSYEITVTDNYRNTVTLRLVLDFTPPLITLDGAGVGGAVRNDVTVSAFDYDWLYLTDAKGNKLKDIESGETFSAPGRYYVTASDYAGNSATVSFTIDLEVEYTLSVPNGAVTSDSVTINSAEPLTIAAKKDGENITAATRFAETGFYELLLTDGIGNTVSCVFVIVPKRVRMLERSLPVGTHVAAVMLDGAPIELSDANALKLDTTGKYTVALDCGGAMYELVIEVDNTAPVVTIEKDGSAVKLAAIDKENIELKLTKDGEEISCSVGKTFGDSGHYVLTVTDDLGNVAVYEFDIPFRLNTWAIVAIAVGGVALIVVIVLIIRARRKPRMK